MEIEELVRKVIGVAINVHRELGPGYLESVYESALAVELAFLGVRFERQKVVPIHYRGRPVGEHRLNLLIENRLIVENKAVAEIVPVFYTFVRSYLKAMALADAVIFNFAAMPLTIKRVGPEDVARFHTHHPERHPL